MKRTQIGFAAVVAVLAMSFTISEHNRVFKGKALKATTDCFLPGGSTALKIKSSCTASAVSIATTDACTITANGDKVWSLDKGNAHHSSEISTWCPGGGTFCCFQVAVDNSPCASPNPVQPTFDIGAGAKAYKVSAVFCHP